MRSHRAHSTANEVSESGFLAQYKYMFEILCFNSRPFTHFPRFPLCGDDWCSTDHSVVRIITQQFKQYPHSHLRSHPLTATMERQLMLGNNCWMCAKSSATARHRWREQRLSRCFFAFDEQIAIHIDAGEFVQTENGKQNTDLHWDHSFSESNCFIRSHDPRCS